MAGCKTQAMSDVPREKCSPFTLSARAVNSCFRRILSVKQFPY